MNKQVQDVSISAEFYEAYARDNAIDSLQLSLLDLLYQANGPITFIALQHALDCTRTRLIATAAELRAQDLVEYNSDQIRLTLSAPFMIEEVLEDLHTQYDQYLKAHPVHPDPRFLA